MDGMDSNATNANRRSRNDEIDLIMIGFAENPEPRCACVLLLNTSGSMRGDSMNALNQGVETYIKTLRGDSLASLRIETAVVSFDSEVRLVQDFATAYDVSPISLEASGRTTGAASAINYALDLVDSRKRAYREAGVGYYRPWVIMISDGASTDSQAQMRAASQRVHQAEESKQVAFFCVGVEGAAMNNLNALGPRGALPLRGHAFVGFFQWLFTSMSTVSTSRQDEELSLPSPSEWAKM